MEGEPQKVSFDLNYLDLYLIHVNKGDYLIVYFYRFPSSKNTDWHPFRLKDIRAIRRFLGIPVCGLPDTKEVRYALIDLCGGTGAMKNAPSYVSLLRRRELEDMWSQFESRGALKEALDQKPQDTMVYCRKLDYVPRAWRKSKKNKQILGK